MGTRSTFALLLATSLVVGNVGRGCAEPTQVRIGGVKLASNAPLFIADEKRYFAAEDLAPSIIFFSDAQSIIIGVTSGDLDFGVTGITAGFYALAGQGAVKLVGGTVREVPSFRLTAVLASNRAADAGLKTYGDLAGRSIATIVVGGPLHYATFLLADKFGVNLKTVRIVAVQSIPNVLSAVTGSQIDVGLVPATAALPAVQRGDLKLLGFAGDEVQWQSAGLFVASKTLNERASLVDRFVRAFRRAARDYHDAFTGPNEQRHDEPNAADILKIIAEHVGQSPAQIEQALPYIDADARLDTKDLSRQLSWYRSQGMLKGEVGVDQIFDKRTTAILP